MSYDLDAARAKFGGKRLPPEKIVAFLERYFPDVKPRKGGEEYRICNPFDDDTGFNFNINPERGVCHDWRSNSWAGPVNPSTQKRNCSFLKFVTLFLRCSYADAVRAVLGGPGSPDVDLKAYLRPEHRRGSAVPARKVAVALPAGTDRLAGSDDSQAMLLRAWLRLRGYEEPDIDKHDLYYLAMEVYWPYYEFDELIYWQSRNRFNKIYRFPDLQMFDNSGKVIAETAGKKSDFLYGFDDVEPAGFVIITESIFGQYTLYDQCLASGGASLSQVQVGKLKILGPRKGVILSPDNDAAGIKSVISNHRLLAPHGWPLYYSLPPRLPYDDNGEQKHTKDWNELLTELKLSRQEIRQIHDKRVKKLTTISLGDLYRLVK